MKLAYLVNQYPKISHSFIRRELLAVEALAGEPVLRVSIREVHEPLVDDDDIREKSLTRVLLDGDKSELAKGAGASLLRPAAFRKALAQTFSLGIGSDRGLVRHFAYLAEAAALAKWCREEGVEHVHAHFGTNPAAVAMLCHALGGPPYSFTAHGTETFDFPPFIGIGQKVARAAFVVAVSEYGKSQLCRWSDFEHWEKIHVVRCGADDQFFAEEITPIPETPRLVCVARLSEEKGHLVMLSACRILKERGVEFELELVGDGHLRERLESDVRKYGLEESVIFAGWGDGAAVRAAIDRARALVLPSFMEGLPVVLMEAFAMGRPAIATHVSGIPELVTHECGYLVPAGASEPLADAMQTVLEAAGETLATMGRKGREAVRSRHDAGAEAKRLYELICQYSPRS